MQVDERGLYVLAKRYLVPRSFRAAHLAADMLHGEPLRPCRSTRSRCRISPLSSTSEGTGLHPTDVRLLKRGRVLDGDQPFAGGNEKQKEAA
jgi:hypothetical protein